MRHFRFFSLFICLLFANLSQGETPDVYQTCIACHGPQGQGNSQLKAPQLAGQQSWYIQRQLQNFATGLRGQHADDVLGKQMQVFAASLSQEQIKQVSDYIAQLQGTKPDNTTAGDLKNGSRYYQAKCGACHGGQGQGNKAFQAPALSNLDADYILRQMTAFKQGVRGTEKADKYGRQMAMMAKTVSEKELADIVFYIGELNP